MEYPKIQTLFLRDEKSIIIPDKFTLPEFEYLMYCPWECTEKVDGCLIWSTRIQMADGSVKLIKDVKVGDLVIGYDTESKEVKAVEVQGVCSRPAAGTWVKVKVSHKGLDKGNSFGTVVCTFDHKIWTTNGYKEAYTLTTEDKVLSIRHDLSLTPIQRSILVGKMLGDGTLCVKNNEYINSASVEFGHTEEAMTDWTLQGLQELAGNKHTRTSGYGSTIYVGRTKSFPSIYNEFSEWITEEEGKQVPESVFLDPISIAFWYMDDGTLCHNESQEDRVRFATNGFNKISCEYLQRELNKFGIQSTLVDYKGNTICLNAENSEKLFLLVAPYICKEYQYKLPERYRNVIPFLPKASEQQYHKLLVEQDVLEVIQEDTSHVRWDLQTETHNFFTTTCLVHNTNMRIEIHFIDDKVTWSYKGRTEKAQIPTHLMQRMQELFDEVEWRDIFPTVESDTHITIYGEGYGMKIQTPGNRYIKDHADFILFDVKVGNLWLSRESYEDIADKLNVQIVPLIGYMDIPTAMEYVKDGFKSLISEDKTLDAEGLVLKTPTGLLRRNGERLITKIKTADFRKYKNVYGDNKVEQKINSHYENS